MKLGVHCVTQRTAAVKIINREKLSKSVMMKVSVVAFFACLKCVMSWRLPLTTGGERDSHHEADRSPSRTRAV